MNRLFGAYWTEARPFEHRGLLLRIETRTLLGPSGQAPRVLLSGVIEAEGLAACAPLEGSLSLEMRGPRMTLGFVSSTGAPQRLCLAFAGGCTPLGGLTTLAGEIRVPGEASRWAAAEVRLDWRRLLLV